jgi:hypothetical protein
MARLVERSVSCALAKSYRWAVQRAEPWSIVGHGSARLQSLLTNLLEVAQLALAEPLAIREPRPTNLHSPSS